MSIELLPSSTAVTTSLRDPRDEDKSEIVALLRFVKRAMTAREVAAANDIARSRARVLLEELASAGAIERDGSCNEAAYRTRSVPPLAS